MVTAVLSRNMSNAQNFSVKLNYYKVYDNMDKFLKDEDICAVYKATLDTLHCIQTVKSLESKIPVLCEKFFAMDFEKAK